MPLTFDTSNMLRQLAASAVAVILPSSGSSNATGQITHTTALPATPVGTVKVFLPAGVVTGGSQGSGAGLYDATYSSTTVCQLTGTGITTANGAYTQVLTEVALATTTVPAGAMGTTGALEICSVWSMPNNANNKIMRARLGGIGGTAFLSRTETASVILSDVRRIRNRGAANAQLGSFPAVSTGGVGSTTSALTTGAADMTAAQDVVFTGTLAVATDFIILEGRELRILP